MDGGHEVPISKIVSRYYKSLENAAQIIGIVDRAYIYDNSAEDELPQLLYRMSDGILIKRYKESLPEWAQALLIT